MSARFSRALVVAAVIALGACTATYQERTTGGTEASTVKLDPARNVMVAIPADGAYGGKSYLGTGQLVAQNTSAAFSRYARKVQLGPAGVHELEPLLVSARAANADYLAIPSISHWEQRATEWSGIPSRVTLTLAIVDVRTGKELHSSLLESQSAIMTLVRPHADALAQRLIDDNVTGLYQR